MALDQQRPVEISLAERATWLNDGVSGSNVADSLKLLAENERLGYGVPKHLGGSGGTVLDIVEAIAAVSEQCLTSGFAFWCQRVFIEYLVASNNPFLQQEILPQILRAELSGATGLSNAIKHGSGLEPLQVKATLKAGAVTLHGFLPWVSNLHPETFVAAVIAQTQTGEAIAVAVPAAAKGLERGEDLQLLGLQAAWTSALRFDQVSLSRQWIISEDANAFLTQIHPTFLLMRCGLSLGMARRSLQESLQSVNGVNEPILKNRLRYHFLMLPQLEAQIWHLSMVSTFGVTQLRQIMQLRLGLTRLVMDAVWVELEAKGSSAYLKPSGTARRLREAAFLPLLTPSLVQLEAELQSQIPEELMA
jgi:alkylation response protein AidB-like acyl-CoA dehydrogenase